MDKIKEKMCKNCKNCICYSCEQVAKLEQELENNFKLCSDCSTTHSFNLQISENKKIQAENEKLYEENAELKAELEQEKALKETYFTYYRAKHDDVKGTFFQLKAECERLKEEKQELSIEIVNLTSKLFTLEKSSNDLSQGTNKLYKTLKEIREDIKDCNNGKCLSCKYNSNNLDNCRDKMDCSIISKINEVIGAEE